MSKDDLIIAFFPCTRFEEQILLSFRGDSFQQKNHTDEQKLINAMKLHDELHQNFILISQMVIICLRKGLKLIIENPYGSQHYLKRYWSIKPALIDNDRTKNGDYFKKPTQYFFINCEPQNNIIFEPMEWVEQRTIEFCTNKDGKSRQERRSEIHPQYASRFIRQQILTTT